MKKAIYSGTFDPFTIGHLDIIRKANLIFDEIVIAVAVSKDKKPMFSIDKRVEIIETSVKEFPNVKVESFDTLLVDFANKKDIYNIIRGVRNGVDFEYEKNMNSANNYLEKQLNTIFFLPNKEHEFISSSLVRELIKFNKDATPLLCSQVIL
jgi:pantetheine-phosphate adenylyltransferase